MNWGRRDTLQFLAALGVGSGGALLFQYLRPVGDRIDSTATVENILADPDAPRTGPDDAAITIAVYTDYDCGICRRSYGEMHAALTNRADVRVLYKEWPILGANSVTAARVALAADKQGVYAPLHDRLMRRTGRLSDAELRTAVEGAGGDWTRLQADLTSDAARIDRALARVATEAFALGLQGTPAYLIGPTLVRGGLDEAGFRRALREAAE
jgi:protein-disulfide isomerase